MTPSWDHNPYHNPADHEPPLEIVAGFDAYEASWDFDIFLVVREKDTGKLYAAHDSGCSCPTPFEDHTWPDDYTEIKSWQECKRLLDQAFPPNGSYRARRPIDSLRSAVQNACRPESRAAALRRARRRALLLEEAEHLERQAAKLREEADADA